MTDNTVSITQTGCYLDNHRGHYIGRDVIELAVSYGFIIGQFEQFAVNMYDEHNSDESYPSESMIELADDAIEWLNSGHDLCPNCEGNAINPTDGEWFTRKDDPESIKWCRKCTGTGRGPRIAGQNFPPRIPYGFIWGWNEGDFGLYPSVLFNIYDAYKRFDNLHELDIDEARKFLQHTGFVNEGQIERLLHQSSADVPLQIDGFTVEAIDPMW